MSYHLGLIGYPIKHSLSPWIHQQFLNQTGLKGTYDLFEFQPDQDFSNDLDQLKEKNIHGFNVTVPYKEKIIHHLDALDHNAKAMGAVNTVYNRNGEWIGYNTDGIGYVRSLLNKFPQLEREKEKRILLIGAGGAARGIYYALMIFGFSSIDIANRTLQSARNIAHLRLNHVDTNVISLQKAETDLYEYDIIIQTTSVGMKPNIDHTIIHLSKVKTGCIVSDIVYQPIKTKFLTEAEKLGASIHFGHTMLLYQAQAAFEIWTFKKAKINNLDQKLERKLRGE